MSNVVEQNVVPDVRSFSTGRVVVFIPAYNEERFIGSVVIKATNYADDVIIFDDGSRNKTADVALLAGALVVKHETNQGKGGALNSDFRAFSPHSLKKLSRNSVGFSVDSEMPFIPNKFERRSVKIPMTAWRMAKAMLWAPIIPWRETPDVIISLGIKITLSFMVWGQVLRKKTNFIESWCRTDHLSLTGRLVMSIVDHFWSQWHQLLSICNAKAAYRGAII